MPISCSNNHLLAESDSLIRSIRCYPPSLENSLPSTTWQHAMLWWQGLIKHAT